MNNSIDIYIYNMYRYIFFKFFKSKLWLLENVTFKMNLMQFGQSAKARRRIERVIFWPIGETASKNTHISTWDEQETTTHSVETIIKYKYMYIYILN